MDYMTVNSEEQLLPLIRARTARKLFDMGFKAKEISSVLKVTPAAVTQYLKGRRGNKLSHADSQEKIIDILADRAARKIRSNSGPVETVEFFDIAYQLLSATRGQRTLERRREKVDNQPTLPASIKPCT